MKINDTSSVGERGIARRDFLKGVTATVVGTAGVLSASGPAGAVSFEAPDDYPLVSTRDHFDGSANLDSSETETSYDIVGDWDGYDQGQSELSVFVHGWRNDDSDDNDIDGAYTCQQGLEDNGYDAFNLGFSWDSDKGSGFFLGWNDGQEIADKNGPKLAQWIVDHNDQDGRPIRLIAHSLGARVTGAALNELRERGRADAVKSVSLLGGAIPTDSVALGGKYGQGIQFATEQLDNFHKTDDGTLTGVYEFAESGEAVGAFGIEGGTSPPDNYEDHNVTDTVTEHGTYYEPEDGCAPEITDEFDSGGGGGNNTPPTASASADATTIGVGDVVNFDGTGSSDPDGSITSYEWDFGDGTTATGATADHTYSSSGSYDVALTVTDNEGATDSDTVTVTAEANQGPTAAASADTSTIGVGDVVTFDGTNSSDSDGTISSYEWDFGDGTTATGATADHTYSSSGSYTVTLTVTDDDGATDTDTVTVTAEANQGPTAAASADSNTVGSGESVSFDGTNSSDPDGSIASYEWDFDDGTTATGASVDHSFGSAGSYDVTLTVTDDDGATATDSVSITVESGGGAPTARIDTVPDDLDDWIRLDGTGSSDPEGDSLSYQWSVDSGYIWSGSSDTDPQPWVNIDGVDELTATLTVTDSEGLSDTAERTFDFGGGGGGDNQAPDAQIGTVPDDLSDWIRLDGTESSDPDGDSLSYQWSVDSGYIWSGSSDTDPQPWVNIDGVDELTATLTVTDDGGLTDTADRTFNVSG